MSKVQWYIKHHCFNRIEGLRCKFLQQRLQQNGRPTPHCILSKNQSSVRPYKLWPKPGTIWLWRKADELPQGNTVTFICSSLSSIWNPSSSTARLDSRTRLSNKLRCRVFITQNLSWYRFQILLSTEGTALSRWKQHNDTENIKSLVSTALIAVLTYLPIMLLVFSHLFRLRGRHHRFKQYVKGTRTARIAHTFPW